MRAEAGDVGDVTLIAGLAEQGVLEGGVAVVVVLNLLLDKGFLPVRNLGEVGMAIALAAGLARLGVLALHDEIDGAAVDQLVLRVQSDVDPVVRVLGVRGVDRLGDAAVVDHLGPVRGAVGGLRLIKVDVAAAQRAAAGLAGFGARDVLEEGRAQIHRQHRRRCRAGDLDGVQGGGGAEGEEQVEPAVGIGGPDGEAVRPGEIRSRGVEVAAVGGQRRDAEFRCGQDLELDRVPFRIGRGEQPLGIQGRGELLGGDHSGGLVEQVAAHQQQRPGEHIGERPGRQAREQLRGRVEDANHCGVQLLEDGRRVYGCLLRRTKLRSAERDR